MKKKLFAIFLSVISAVCCTASFAGCNDEEVSGGENGGNTTSHTHTYSDEWSKDNKYHWHGCTIDGCTEIKDKAEHDFTNGDCFCGKKAPLVGTEGLIYGFDCAYDFYECEEAGLSGVGTAKGENLVVASEYNGKPVTGILSGAFDSYNSFKSLTIPDTITNIDNGIFDDCDNLKYNEYDNAYYLGNEENKYVALVKAKSTDITSCKINENTKCIASSAFEDCSLLTSINIPDSVIKINAFAFSDCVSLTNVTIPDSILKIGEVTGSSMDAFEHCDNLKYNEYGNAYYLGNEKNPYVALMGLKENVTSIDINVNTKTIALSESFYFHPPIKINYKGDLKSWCKISNVYVLMDGYVRMDGDVDERALIIDGKEIAGDLVIPDGVTEIKSAFYTCTKLESVTIPDSVTHIGLVAFAFTGLKSITIPKSVTNIGFEAFASTGLKSVILPDSVTHIGYGSFGYTPLESITIPDSVTFIGISAFEGCEQLKDIIYTGTKAQWKAIVKGGVLLQWEAEEMWKEGTGEFTVHCTDGDISKADA